MSVSISALICGKSDVKASATPVVATPADGVSITPAVTLEHAQAVHAELFSGKVTELSTLAMQYLLFIGTSANASFDVSTPEKVLFLMGFVAYSNPCISSDYDIGRDFTHHLSKFANAIYYDVLVKDYTGEQGDFPCYGGISFGFDQSEFGYVTDPFTVESIPMNALQLGSFVRSCILIKQDKGRRATSAEMAVLLQNHL